MGGRGGPDVSFKNVRIGAINPLPPPKEGRRRREGAKTLHFGIIEMGEGGALQMFHFFCSRL